MAGASKSTRALAAAAAVADCASHGVMMRAGVDTRKVMRGTDYDAPLMKSKMAIERGRVFEARLAADDHDSLRTLVMEEYGVEVAPEDIHDLDKIEGRTESELAVLTVSMIGRALDDGKPTLIREARIDSPLGNVLKSDYLLVAGDLVRILEAKSWPVVDGRPIKPSLFSSAVDQAALYIVILRDLLYEAGWERETVSEEFALLNPRNVGYEPILTRHSSLHRLVKARDVIESALDHVASDDGPEVEDPNVDALKDDDEDLADLRVRKARKMIDQYGHVFDPVACHYSCGLVNLCHEIAYRRGDVSVIGTHVQEHIPGVTSLIRVRELIEGATPSAEEVETAEALRQAAARIDSAMGGSR